VFFIQASAAGAPELGVLPGAGAHIKIRSQSSVENRPELEIFER